MIPWLTRVHIPNRISIGSDIFAQLTPERLRTLLWASLYHPPIYPSKLPVPMVGSRPHMIHRAYPSPKPKRHLDWFSRLCTVHRRVSLYFATGRPSNPSKLPIPMARSAPQSNNDSLGQIESETQTVSRSVKPSLRGSRV